MSTRFENVRDMARESLKNTIGVYENMTEFELPGSEEFRQEYLDQLDADLATLKTIARRLK